MFPCPRCDVTLARAKARRQMLWVCPSCGGRAATLAALRRDVSREFLNALWARAREGAGRRGARCPACANPGVEVFVEHERRAWKLDVCRSCAFVWFDAKELETAPEAPPDPGAARPLSLEAREAVARVEIERIRARSEAGADAEELPAGWQYLPALFGLPVELRAEPLRGLPVLTWGIAAAVAFASVLAFSDLEAAVRAFALLPNDPWRIGGLPFLSSFFLHGGVLHLAGNLYFLLIFGDNVEDFLGKGRFALLVLAATLAGNAVHALFDPHPFRPVIGASGGISGIIAFYALKFPHARLGFLFRFHLLLYLRIIRLPAWGALILWLLLQAVLVTQQLTGTGNVSALAHLGGAAVGVALWALWRKD